MYTLFIKCNHKYLSRTFLLLQCSEYSGEEVLIKNTKINLVHTVYKYSNSKGNILFICNGFVGQQYIDVIACSFRTTLNRKYLPVWECCCGLKINSHMALWWSLRPKLFCTSEADLAGEEKIPLWING